MSALVDKAVTKLAGKAFDVFYDNMLSSGLVKADKQNQLKQGLDAVRSLLSQGDKRPLDVNLRFPQSWTSAYHQTVDQMSDCMPTEKDLSYLYRRTNRILTLIESILTRHEQLAIETIRTLRTIRLVTKWTAFFIVISLLYLYVRKFHSQSSIYQLLAQRRMAVAFLLGGIGLVAYCYTNKKHCLRTISAIS